MSIVFITIPGESKREFANLLHRKTDGGIVSVVIQKPKKAPVGTVLKKLIKTVGVLGLPRELFYAALLRVDAGVRGYLDYFHSRTKKEYSSGYDSEVVEVESVNSDRVHKLLQKTKPKLIVVWGTGVIKPHIFRGADATINLHMGIAEHYRGAPANQFAVLAGEKEKIGVTIHYLNEEVDAGDIIETITVEEDLPPNELFTRLNDRAEERLLDIAERLWRGEKFKTVSQKKKRGRNVLLREWIPSRRYRVAREMRAWEARLRN